MLISSIIESEIKKKYISARMHPFRFFPFKLVLCVMFMLISFVNFTDTFTSFLIDILPCVSNWIA